jgi:hypothetical protein
MGRYLVLWEENRRTLLRMWEGRELGQRACRRASGPGSRHNQGGAMLGLLRLACTKARTEVATFLQQFALVPQR